MRRQITISATVSIDSLREANINENQQFLTIGFLRAVDPEAQIVIIDGHSVIDTPSGLVPIEPAVFAKLRIQRVIFLVDDPSEIFRRRAGDRSRNRPARTVDDLRPHESPHFL